MIEQYLHVCEKCPILVSHKNDALFVSSTSHFQIQIHEKVQLFWKHSPFLGFSFEMLILN
jgi:hypothetical protein